jgi:hypothetical protein
MSLTWHLPNYRKHAQRPCPDLGIRPGALRTASDIPPDTRDVPGPHMLTSARSERLAETSGQSIEPDRFDCFLEAAEDWLEAAED